MIRVEVRSPAQVRLRDERVAEIYQRGLCVIKNIFSIIIVAITTSLHAETLSFPSFQVEIQDGWEYSIENISGDGWGSVISLRHPNGVGSLKILSYNAPAVVSEDILRNMTNVDSSTPLTW